MNFDNEQQIFDFIKDAERSADMIRQQLATRMGIDGCYYEGIHWLVPNFRLGPNRDSGTARLPVDWNPDSRKLRAMSNEVTRLTQKSAASTHPDEIYVDAVPPDRDTGTDALFRVRVHESVANTAIDECGLLRAAQLANHRRCIFGTWGIGLSMEDGTLLMNGQEVPSRCVKAFDFDPSNLITDPHCQKLDLYEHPWVLYTDVWTLDRVKSVLGLEIPPDQASTVEQLEPTKMDLNAISNNRLFTRYARFAKTKAVRIYQLHDRRYGYRFDRMYITVETADKNKTLVNADNVDTPFGGRGLPFALLHGYLRSDTMWSWGEPAQIKDDQDKANLVETMQQRILQRHGNPIWLVDKRAFGHRPNSDDIARALTNQVGGIVEMELGDRQRNVQVPQIVQTPTPPPYLMEALSIYSDRMREKIHKAPGNFGSTPTHVPFKTTERVLDDADQVSSVRVALDVHAIEGLVGTLHATTIKMAQEQNPETLGFLRKAGLDGQDFAIVAQEDWVYPGVNLKVRQASVRHQSQASKKQNLDTAAQLQMIEPDQYQQALADNGIDMALTEEWRQMADQCRRAGLAVMMGEPFMPRPMGRWGQLLINELIRAQMDRRVRIDPMAGQRLAVAIQQQYDMMRQEQFMANPELQMQAMQAASSQGDGQEEQSEGQPQEGDSVSVADLLGSLSQSGPSGGRQPAAA